MYFCCTVLNLNWNFIKIEYNYVLGKSLVRKTFKNYRQNIAFYTVDWIKSNPIHSLEHKNNNE